MKFNIIIAILLVNKSNSHSEPTPPLNKCEYCCLMDRILQNLPGGLIGTIDHYLVIVPTVIVISILKSVDVHSFYQKWFCQHLAQAFQQKFSVLRILRILSKDRHMWLTWGINHSLFEYGLEYFHDNPHYLSPEGDFIDQLVVIELWLLKMNMKTSR